MKNIELTEDHKSKLLKMCKELFPEFNEWRYGKVTSEGNLEDFYNKTKDLSWQDREKYEQSCDFLWIEKDFKYEHDDDIERSETWVIHWFEFVMTHLCDKISTKLTNEMCTGMPQYYDESEKLDWNSQSLISMLKECHPIDYLYEEFKKLK